MKNDSVTKAYSTPAAQVDGAGGVPATLDANIEKKWFVAIVGRNTEKACRERLQSLGYESFAATQEETRVWRSGQKKQVERVVISTLLFVHATERERLQTLKLPFIKHYMTDKAMTADSYGRHPLAVIPDEQIRLLSYMLYHSDSPVSFVTTPLRLGDRIRVIRGSLTGFEGNITRMGGSTYIVASIDLLGYAMVDISPADVERVA